MNCAYHAEAQNVAFCIRCGRALCSQCIRNVRGSVYCEDCLAEALTGKTVSPASHSKSGVVGGLQFGEIEDKHLWGGVALIVIGILFLLGNLDLIDMSRIGRVLWPVILIALGLWRLKKKL